jgi:hypothetical protein
METRRRQRLTCCLLAAAGAFLAPACGAGGPGGSGPGRDTFKPSSASLEYVRASPYGRLVLEVDRVAGTDPRAVNRNAIASRLAGILDKPLGVEVTLDGLIASRGSDHVWSTAEVRALATATLDLAVAADTVKMHVLFLDGRYEGSGSGGTVLGVAFDQRHMAIFHDEIERTCAAAGLGVLTEQVCSDAELAIWLHEAGHLLGLVDIGLVMQSDHEDVDHPGHDHDPDCVMYWAYEGDALIERLADQILDTGNGALDFDAECLADIAAAR